MAKNNVFLPTCHFKIYCFAKTNLRQWVGGFRAISKGVYYCTLQVNGERIKTQKIVLIK